MKMNAELKIPRPTPPLRDQRRDDSDEEDSIEDARAADALALEGLACGAPLVKFQ